MTVKNRIEKLIILGKLVRREDHKPLECALRFIKDPDPGPEPSCC